MDSIQLYAENYTIMIVFVFQYMYTQYGDEVANQPWLSFWFDTFYG